MPPGSRAAGSRNKLSRPAAGARDQWRVRCGYWSVVSGRWSSWPQSGRHGFWKRGGIPTRARDGLGRGENGAAMRGRRVDGKKIRRLHGRAWSEDPTVDDCQCLNLIFKCREISSPPQHDTDKSQDVTSSATSATEQNTRNRTWHDDSIPKRKRKLSIWRVSREQQGPTRRRTSWEGPGTALGKTRQSKEAENAFINPRSWPGRRTAMGVADEAVMVCVCVCGWWSRRCMSREGKKKKKKKPAGRSVVVSRQTVAHARIKRPSTRGPGPPRWPPPPPANQTGGNQPGRGTAGREGVQGGNGGP